MPSTAEKEIIELTDVVEEGHPDQPNLPPQGASPASNEVLDDLDLEKEIDQIFADLGAPSSADEGFEGQKKSPDDPLDLDNLFGEPHAAVEKQHPDAIQAEQAGEPAMAVGESPDLVHPEEALVPSEAVQKRTQSEEDTVDDSQPHSAHPEEFQSAGHGKDSESSAPMPMESDQLAPLLERLAAMEENVARLDKLDQLFSERLEARLETLAKEVATNQQETLATLRRELRSELEEQFEQMLRGAIEEANARSQDSLTQGMARQAEEMTALIDSRFQDLHKTDAEESPVAVQDQLLSEVQTRTMEVLRPLMDNLRSEWETAQGRLGETADSQAAVQEATQALQDEWRSFQKQAENANQKISDALSAQLEQLRTELLQELQAAIPSVAARIIREEIQALSQGEG